jgi:hypothetical protein
MGLVITVVAILIVLKSVALAIYRHLMVAVDPTWSTPPKPAGGTWAVRSRRAAPSSSLPSPVRQPSQQHSPDRVNSMPTQRRSRGPKIDRQ